MTGILISWGPINPYGLGLMSLSPIIWKYRELIDPIAHIYHVAKYTNHMGVSKTTGTPKWMVKISWKTPLKMDDLGGKNPYFWVDTHMGIHHGITWIPAKTGVPTFQVWCWFARGRPVERYLALSEGSVGTATRAATSQATNDDNNQQPNKQPTNQQQ